MERKQKRGWLKFALTTAMAFAFMGIMAVTAFAGSYATVTLVPTQADDSADMLLHVYVDIEDDRNIGVIRLDLSWPTNLFTLEYVMDGPNRRFATLAPRDPWIGWSLLAVAPPDQSAAVGNFVIGLQSIHVPEPPAAGATSEYSGPAAIIRFNAVDGAWGTGTVGLGLNQAVTIVDGAPPRPQDLADGTVTVSGIEVNAALVGWGYYGYEEGSAEREFITAVTGPHLAWFTFLHNDVWQAALDGEGTIQAAHTAWQAWIAAAA